MKQITKEWPITNLRCVGFIDIMGFKDMVQRNKHETIYEMMKKIDATQELNRSIPWSNKGNLISMTTFSDSIIVYSRDNTYDSLYSFICTMSSLTNDLLSLGIPHKGACAYGRMTIDTKKSIFFGQPLIDAYLLEEEVNFYGIIMHSTMEERFDYFTQRKKDFVFTQEYECLFKTGKAKHSVIYPFYAHTGVISAEHPKRAEELFESVKKFRFKTSGGIRKYIDETLKFLCHIRPEYNER